MIVGSFPLAPYKDQLDIEGEVPTHTTSWNVNLAKSLARMKDTEVHVVNFTTAIKRSKTVTDQNAAIHFQSVTPKLNILTLSQYYRYKLREIALSIRPDIINGVGMEHGYPYLAVTSGCPHVITIDPVLRELRRVSHMKGNLRHWLLEKFERFTLRRARHIIVRTPFTMHSVKHLTSAKFYVVDNSVERFFFELDNHKASHSHDDSEFKLLFVGRISPEKDLLTLIKSLWLVTKKMDRRTRLQIIGQAGPNTHYLKKIQDEVDNYGLADNVDFLGHYSRHEVARFMQAADLLVLPSLYESFGMVLAEAMAVGTPVVASKAASIPYIVTHGETGLLFEPGDREELSNHILALLKDNELRTRMGESGRQEATERFHPEVVAKRTREVYEDVLGAWYD